MVDSINSTLTAFDAYRLNNENEVAEGFSKASSALESSKSQVHLKTSSFTDIKAQRVDWLWKGWLPKGCLSLIAGDPKSGKSLITLYLASIVANGGLFPDGQRAEGGQNVFIWTDEDDPARVVKNRLLALTKDLDRIRAIESKYDSEGLQLPFNPSKDLDLLGAEIKRHGGAGLIILDPIYKAIDGDMNSLQDSSRSLTMLQQFAGDFNLSILGINHFRKGGSGAPQDRMIGSKAFSSVPRSIFMAKRDENIANRGMMSRIVASYSSGEGVATYETQTAITEEEDETVKVVFTGWDADKVVYDALDEAIRLESSDHSESSKGCSEWLVDYLESVGGILESEEIIDSARKAGYSQSTLYRTRKSVEIHSKTSGFGAGKISIWFLKDSESRVIDFIEKARKANLGDHLENSHDSQYSHDSHTLNAGKIEKIENYGDPYSLSQADILQKSAQTLGNVHSDELSQESF